VDASSRLTSIAVVQSVARTVVAGLKSSALKRIAETLSPCKIRRARLFWDSPMEEERKLPFHKKMSTLSGAGLYAEMALETYPEAKATIEPIDEGFWKYLITVEEAKKEK
jgi:hypothetical protein